MVLERIVGMSLLKKQPDVALFLGFIFTLIAFLTSYMIFVSGMSVAMIGFASLLMLPYINKIMKPESPEYRSVFHKENTSIKFFAWLFFGMALAYTILFGILRPDVRDIAFRTQINIVEGQVGLSGGMFGLPIFFYEIVSNNLIIVAIAIILSFFYGAGSVFVLNYNASIAGIVYGSWLSGLIWPNPSAWGASEIALLYQSPVLFLPHTILEILAYLLAAIAGLIISKPLTNRNHKLVERDTILLLVAAVVLIIAGGLVEITVPFL